MKTNWTKEKKLDTRRRRKKHLCSLGSLLFWFILQSLHLWQETLTEKDRETEVVRVTSFSLSLSSCLFFFSLHHHHRERETWSKGFTTEQLQSTLDQSSTTLQWRWLPTEWLRQLRVSTVCIPYHALCICICVMLCIVSVLMCIVPSSSSSSSKIQVEVNVCLSPFPSMLYWEHNCCIVLVLVVTIELLLPELHPCLSDEMSSFDSRSHWLRYQDTSLHDNQLNDTLIFPYYVCHHNHRHDQSSLYFTISLIHSCVSFIPAWVCIWFYVFLSSVSPSLVVL